MKLQVCFLLFFLFSVSLFGQKTLLVEKIGKSAKYYYHVGDKIKVKTLENKTVYKGVLTGIMDSSLTISSISSNLISVSDIAYVYRQFLGVRRMGFYFMGFGGIIFLVIAVNNLINNNQVFTQYAFIVSGSFIGAGLISLALSEKRHKIGTRWKVKILNGTLN
jgi:hypothetical protein